MAEAIETGKRPDLTRLLVVLGWVGMMIFAFHACTHMVAAGDTWVAMACGRHFINHGVDTVEPFSANSHKAGPTEQEIEKWPGWARSISEKVGLETVKYWHPTGWINQNWLTHVIFYWLTHLSPFADADTLSYNSVVYWKFAVYIICVICVYYTARILGAGTVMASVFSCFAMFVGRSFIDIRPAGFSNLMVAIYLLILVLTTYRNVLYVWLIVPAVVFWCNVHGGYIYAFIMLVPFIGLHLLMYLPKRWTVSIYNAFLWVVLYGLAYKFLSHQHLTQIHLADDRMLYLLVVFAAVSLIIAPLKRIKAEAFYGYHIFALLIVFLCVLARFFPSLPPGLSENARRVVQQHISESQISFILTFVLLVFLGLVVAFFKDRLVCIKLKGVLHTRGDGIV